MLGKQNLCAYDPAMHPLIVLASHSEALIEEFCDLRLQLEHGVIEDLS